MPNIERFSRRAWLVLAACLLLPPTLAEARVISSHARINDDASLRISGKTIHLAGIHIPATRTTCKQFRTPPVCGSRAVVALEFKVDGFS